MPEDKKPSPDTIKPLHPRSFYQAQAMLTGYMFNDFYHAFVQTGSSRPEVKDFMMWDADTWELIGHNTGYMSLSTTVSQVIPETNWNWRHDPFRKYPKEEPT